MPPGHTRGGRGLSQVSALHSYPTLTLSLSLFPSMYGGDRGCKYIAMMRRAAIYCAFTRLAGYTLAAAAPRRPYYWRRDDGSCFCCCRGNTGRKCQHLNTSAGASRALRARRSFLQDRVPRNENTAEKKARHGSHFESRLCCASFRGNIRVA